MSMVVSELMYKLDTNGFAVQGYVDDIVILIRENWNQRYQRDNCIYLMTYSITSVSYLNHLISLSLF